MDNLAYKLDNEENDLSEELIAKVIEREKEIAKNPNAWITVEQLKRDMAKI